MDLIRTGTLTMPTTAPKTDANYTQQFAALAPQLAGWSMPWVESLRRDAYARLQKVGYPTARTEDWRFTNINPLIEKDYALPTKADDARVDLPSLGFADSIAGSRLVFVNGLASQRLSKVAALPKGVHVGTLSQAFANDGSSDAASVLEAHLGRYADSERLGFTAQNLAFFQDGALIVVPDHAVVKEPIHLVFANTANVASSPRNLVVVGKNAQVTIVEWHLGSPGLTNFTNAVTEVVANEHSHVDHVKLQRESMVAYHLANMQVVLQAKKRISRRITSPSAARWSATKSASASPANTRKRPSTVSTWARRSSISTTTRSSTMRCRTRKP
ncbi:MAG: SufD family Fe-S cluster assembly protein [Gemmataceae bacterium]